MNDQFDLQFSDRGYGIAYFGQTINWNGNPLEFMIKDLKADEKERADAIVMRAWPWIRENMEAIKDYLGHELAVKFEEMRQQKAKNVPPDDEVMIRRQLAPISVGRITFFPNQSAFTLDFWGMFNGYQYRMYVSVRDDFTFKRGDILTMGGFKPPKDEPKPDLSKAGALYDYHVRHGNEKGLYQYYDQLSAAEIELFTDRFIADGEEDSDDRLDLPLYLALYAYGCGDWLPDRLYRCLIDREIFYYSEIYLRADEKFAGELIGILDEVDDAEAYRLTVNHILCALAMIPCRRTGEFLIRSSISPLPIWAEKLHILPVEYARTGGWQVMDDGTPLRLTSSVITAFEPCRKTEASPESPLASLPEPCGFCGQPLTLVFEKDNKLASCLYCSCYQTVYTRNDAGRGYWHAANKAGDFLEKHPEYMKNDEDIAVRFTGGLRPLAEKRRRSWTAHQFAEITRTQIGGMPTTVNDITYPRCPDCGRTMHFAAQLDMADVEKYGEGIYYFFTCDECGVVGTNYDQT